MAEPRALKSAQGLAEFLSVRYTAGIGMPSIRAGSYLFCQMCWEICWSIASYPEDVISLTLLTSPRSVTWISKTV